MSSDVLLVLNVRHIPYPCPDDASYKSGRNVVFQKDQDFNLTQAAQAYVPTSLFRYLPVRESIWKLVFPGIKLYRIAAFIPLSLSLARTPPTTAPLPKFSSTLNSYASWEKIGSLSFASKTATVTRVVAVSEGVPLSVAATTRVYLSSVSLSKPLRR